MACLDEQHGMVDVDALLQHHGEIDLGHRAANTFERLAQPPPVVAGEHGAIKLPAALGPGLAQGLAAEHEHDEGESQSAEPARSRQNAVNRATRPVIGPFAPWV